VIKAVFDPRQQQHNPQFFLVKGKRLASTEQPERAERLLTGLARCGAQVVPPAGFETSRYAAVHSDRYLRFLQSASSDWQALADSSDEVIANVHPAQPFATYPQSIIGRAGWHMADTACPLGQHTWAAACCSANSALTATGLVLEGERQTYALCRPPGHHAYADMAGGFCFLNNIAIAAEYARQTHAKVAILDVDVHHGNGTQGIFYSRPDVLTVSIHADPANFYPFFWGHASEQGIDAGEGYNINLPLPHHSADDAFITALDEALDQIAQFCPGILLVALGLDASESDPLRGLSVTTGGFERIGRHIAQAKLPTVWVQEGGYLSPILSDNLAAVLTGAQSV
jgi:acetoin utilization deacetylase AcuC-like enzyme